MPTTPETAFLTALGRHLRQIREGRHLSQEALALKADIDRTYVSSVERGKRNISVLNLRRLGKALSTHPRELLDF